MSPNADATRDKTLGTDRRTDSQPGRYVVIDSHSGRQHARGLSKARAETLAREYCDGVVARRERPDPHWLTRGGSA
jgi:hypothetical protein